MSLTRDIDIELLQAAENGKLEKVTSLLKAGANIEQQTESGWTALRIAADWNHLAVVEYLVKAGANIEHQSKSGDTALLCAARSGHLVVVQCLLKVGANIEHQDLAGWTALLFAAHNNCLAVVQCLLEEGANIEHQDRWGATALMGAAGHGCLAIVQYLLEEGANIEHQDKSAITGRMWAVDRGWSGIVDCLDQFSGWWLELKEKYKNNLNLPVAEALKRSLPKKEEGKTISTSSYSSFSPRKNLKEFICEMEFGMTGATRRDLILALDDYNEKNPKAPIRASYMHIIKDFLFREPDEVCYSLDESMYLRIPCAGSNRK